MSENPQGSQKQNQQDQQDDGRTNEQEIRESDPTKDELPETTKDDDNELHTDTNAGENATQGTIAEQSDQPKARK